MTKRWRVAGYARNNSRYVYGKTKSEAVRKWNRKYCKKGKKCFLRIHTYDLLDD